MRRDAQIERNGAQLIVASSINSIHDGKGRSCLAVRHRGVFRLRNRNTLIAGESCCRARLIPRLALVFADCQLGERDQGKRERLDQIAKMEEFFSQDGSVPPAARVA